jgi:hypothetical protein
MTLYDKIIALYPELVPTDFSPSQGTIMLKDEGQGVYLAKWNHPTLPRPTDEQLA